jgi:hypothetical protein
MEEHKGKKIAAEGRTDLRQLLKEYARMGYKAVHGRNGKDFEALWSAAFDADGAAEKPRV